MVSIYINDYLSEGDLDFCLCGGDFIYIQMLFLTLHKQTPKNARLDCVTKEGFAFSRTEVC